MEAAPACTATIAILAFSTCDLAHALSCDLAGLIVVRRDLRHKLFGIDRRIEDHHWNVHSHGALDHTHHGLFVDRRESDSIEAFIDHGLHDLQLTVEVGLGRGAVPLYFDAALPCRLVCAGMYRLPENVRATLRNDADAPLRVSIAARDDR